MDVPYILGRLTATYGRRFPKAYADADPAKWAAELGSYVTDDAALQHVFLHLPMVPPNARGFREACDAFRLPPKQPEQPAPVDQAFALATLAAFRRPVAQGPQAWAHRLRDREQEGETLTGFQRRAWREALGKGASGMVATSPMKSTT